MLAARIRRWIGWSMIAWAAMLGGGISRSVGGAETGDGADAAGNRPTATAILAGGCFWCVEADFDKLPGVLDVVSGYSGGESDNPTYDDYADGGHREVVKVTYDPTRVNFGGLVEWLIKHVDPTDAGGSFVDRGTQYAPAVYVENDVQRQTVADVVDAIDAMKVFPRAIDLKVEPRHKFWPAEEYHQNYHEKSWIKYKYYRRGSGRDPFVKQHWGDRADRLELQTSRIGSGGGQVHGGAATVGAGGGADDGASSDGASSDGAPSDGASNDDGADPTPRPWEGFVKPSDGELRKRLTPLQYRVTQKDDTERPHTNEYAKNKRVGIYVDIVSGEPLFSSTDKYESGTGWPSFVKPIDPKFITTKIDRGWFQTRTEVRSAIADSHLGHVFEDGPRDRGGKRYCMNSAAMDFVPVEEMRKRGYGNYVSEVSDPH